jgi:hypothetical protein
MKKYLGLFIAIILVSCSSSDSDPEAPIPVNNVPTASNYILPNNNAVCTGVEISDTEINVDFQWNTFQDVEDTNLDYTFTLRNLATNTIVIAESVSGTTKSVILEKGISYSWNIKATDSDNNTTTGATWQFQTPFNAISNYAPFPATMISPDNGQVLTNAEVTLTWEGNDPDDGETEELLYTIYLGTTNPPVQITDMFTAETYTETLTPAVYYWKIDSTDPNGNISNSQIRQFIVE